MSKKSMESNSPISKASLKFQNTDYPLLVRVIDRHLIITSPDFNFPIPIVLPYDPPSVEIGGKGLIAAWLQIAERLKYLEQMKRPSPSPLKSHEIFPRLSMEISLGEACRILGLKPTMVRELADSGEIPSRRTQKGHRRFLRKEIEIYALRIREAHLSKNPS